MANILNISSSSPLPSSLGGTGNSTGTATNATNGATVSTTTNANFFPLFAASSTNSNQPFNLNSSYTFNPSTGTLTVPTRILSGASTLQALTTAYSSRGANNTVDNSFNFYTNSDSQVVFQILPFSHSNVSLNFDCYYSGSAWISSSSTGNFQIVKNSADLSFNYKTGINSGTNFTWSTGLIFNTSGQLNFPLLTASSLLGLDSSKNVTTTVSGLSPTFTGLNLSGLTASSLVVTDGSKNLSSSNILSSTVLNNITKVNVVTITAVGSGSYVPTANCTHIRVRVWGSSGGGGGVSGVTSQCAAAGGGGGGGYAESIITSPTTTSYTIGAKGTGGAAGNNNGTTGDPTTFGGITCNGGAGGTGSAAGVAAATVTGGLGGTASGGNIMNVQGERGGPGIVLTASLGYCGFGGSSSNGGVGTSIRIAGSIVGENGYSPGGGGSGGVSNNSNSRAGGDGVDGKIIIEEYFNG